MSANGIGDATAAPGSPRRRFTFGDFDADTHLQWGQCASAMFWLDSTVPNRCCS
jgi:hypothetical protein